MGITRARITDALVRKARKLTGMKTKRQILRAALELLVRTETRKRILRFRRIGVSVVESLDGSHLAPKRLRNPAAQRGRNSSMDDR